ncbi:MAG: yczJ, partial [Hyphomicrobiales bacterium]|nr:yczJ [Hyphomicrobiales bacterium]
MIIERAELSVLSGKEPEFELAMHRGCALLAAANGCRAVTLHRGLERPSTYLLLLQWDAVADHTAFTETPAFQEFRALIGPFFCAKPQMEHFVALPEALSS